MEFREFAGRKVQLPPAGELVPGDGDFEEELSKAVLTGVSLAEDTRAPLELSDVLLDNVDLSNANLARTTARRVHVKASRGIGLRLVLKQATDLLAEGCRFDYATIEIDRVKHVAVFHECSFRDAVLLGDLSNVVFSGCDFTGAEFQARRAVDCDLRSSDLRAARGLSTLGGAKISTEQAVSIAVRLAVENGLLVVD